ncbi:male sterility protein-domain-containing protein [Irpex rosettiformis]|uniref:Male sterility protein-domain-containing protein n=1 Tax=Irpex rosettiformis TaxID=378272 RepID=A0ACB8TU51_9APHY|nr:male sterility protein-domain-containing protein [Irpex rosettiformis]
MYMHTSGSTGHPKPIAWSHQFVISKVQQTKRDYVDGQGKLMYTPLPIYHGGGFCMTLPVIAGYGGTMTLVEPYRAVSSESVLRHLRILKDRRPDVLLVPNLLEDIVDTLGEQSALYLRIPNTVIQGGAPLRRDVGDKLAHGGVRLITWGGITEAGVFASQVFDPTRDPSDWPYVKLSNGYDFHFTPFDPENPEQGYQLVMSPKSVTPPVVNHENPRGFLTPDIWTKHPTKPGLWRISGRLDDIIVLSNGEKANGKQLETLLCASPYISHVVIFGAGRFLCGALLRPSSEYKISEDSHETRNAYLERVWSYVDTHVNNTVPRHSRLLRPLVLVEEPSKPFQLSDKGTIKKKATLDLYHEQIEQAYTIIEEGEPTSAHSTRPTTAFPDIPSIASLLRRLVSKTIGREIGDNDDFFNFGLDSLLAVKLRFSIISAFKDAGVTIDMPRNVIYAHPTITTVSHYLWSILDKSYQSGSNDTWCSSYSDEIAVTRMIDKVVATLTASFPQRPTLLSQEHSRGKGEVYVVTGTTGSLGSAFLSDLLEQPISVVKKVYLLNRASGKATMMQRHETSFLERELDFSAFEAAVNAGRAVLVDIDVTQERLGINTEVYSQMVAETTHIVHNAWPVTFTYQFQSFMPQLEGLRALIDLALASPRPIPPHLIFISSISVGGRLSSTSSQDIVIPESPMTAVDRALPHGYAMSKFAAEKIIEQATSSTPLRASVVRIGQIAGSLKTGAWHRNEYLPSILRASVRAGRVPDDLFTRPLHWLPVEHASKALYAITQAHTSSPTPLTFYGLENTRPIYWTSVVSSLLLLYPSLHEVPAAEWLHHMHALQDGNDDDGSNAIDGALLDYIDEFVCQKPLPRLATANLRGISSEVKELIDFDYIKNETAVQKYIQYILRA